jgi:hypothetical protein
VKKGEEIRISSDKDATRARSLGDGLDSLVQRHDSQHGGQYIGRN